LSRRFEREEKRRMATSVSQTQILEAGSEYLGGLAYLVLGGFADHEGQQIDQQGAGFEEVGHFVVELVDDDLRLGLRQQLLQGDDEPAEARSAQFGTVGEVAGSELGHL